MPPFLCFFLCFVFISLFRFSLRHIFLLVVQSFLLFSALEVFALFLFPCVCVCVFACVYIFTSIVVIFVVLYLPPSLMDAPCPSSPASTRLSFAWTCCGVLCPLLSLVCLRVLLCLRRCPPCVVLHHLPPLCVHPFLPRLSSLPSSAVLWCHFYPFTPVPFYLCVVFCLPHLPRHRVLPPCM